MPRLTAAAIAIAASSVAVLAQPASTLGPLTPPAGPISGTGPSLAEVSPRLPVNNTNTPAGAGLDSLFTISSPGSYVLTSNITVPPGQIGIVINSDDVSIDLNGFTISGTGPDSGSTGIAAVPGDRSQSNTGLLIHNGFIADVGTAIDLKRDFVGNFFVTTSGVEAGTISDLAITGCKTGIDAERIGVSGCVIAVSEIGIETTEANVERCSVQVVGAEARFGIRVGFGTVRECQVRFEFSEVNATGISVTQGSVFDSHAMMQSLASSTGIAVRNGVASNCAATLPFAIANPHNGFRVLTGAAIGCVVTGFNVGFSFSEGATIQNCSVFEVAAPTQQFGFPIAPTLINNNF
ncbi:MAG: hypothetical protein AAGI17_03770 [Planctomycetota bacterium]